MALLIAGLFYRSRWATDKAGRVMSRRFPRLQFDVDCAPVHNNGGCHGILRDLWTIQTLPCHRERHL